MSTVHWEFPIEFANTFAQASTPKVSLKKRYRGELPSIVQLCRYKVDLITLFRHTHNSLLEFYNIFYEPPWPAAITNQTNQTLFASIPKCRTNFNIPAFILNAFVLLSFFVQIRCTVICYIVTKLNFWETKIRRIKKRKFVRLLYLDVLVIFRTLGSSDRLLNMRVNLLITKSECINIFLPHFSLFS